MKSDRLMSILLLLQAYGQLRTREIADRLEISMRTVHRDMESLCMAGVPLVAHRGVHGGWELDKEWKTEVPGLDPTELQSLLMLQPSSLGDRKLTAAAERAYEKVIASLPKSLHAQAEAIRTRLHIDSTGWGMAVEDVSALPLVQQGVLSDRKLSFLYTRADGESSSRTVEPYGLVCKQTVWYLVASSRQGVRTYRLSRMRDVVVLALPFKRPVRFNLARHWEQSAGELKYKRVRVTVTVAFAPEAAKLASSWLTLTAEARCSGFPKGWTVFKTEFDGYREARFFALGFGSKAKVLRPAELCNQISDELEHLRVSYPPLAR
jgi:predicted DNA-binding transcriptional regulator YafY